MLTLDAIVAPSELEGHLLDHPDVSDVCVVGIPDDYNGELPFAFVVPSTDAARHVKLSPVQGERIKQAIVKVRTWLRVGKDCFKPSFLTHSTYPTTKCATNGSQVSSS